MPERLGFANHCSSVNAATHLRNRKYLRVARLI